MTLKKRNHRLVVVLALSSVLSVLCVQNASSQFKLVHAPDHMRVGQRVNMFFSFDGSLSVDGAYLALPMSWKPESVRLISRSGRSRDVSIRRSENYENRFTLEPASAIVEGEVLKILLTTGDASGPFSLRLTPLLSEYSRTGQKTKFLDELSTRTRFEIAPRRTFGDNRVMSVRPDRSPALVVGERQLSSLAEGQAFTVELWLQTTSTGSIILSTWTGDENTSYPLEVVTDAMGRVIVFRGAPGEHRSMRSSGIVADGAWHHIAVTHDPVSAWNRLIIDGMPADSLYVRDPLPVRAPQALVIGARVGSDSKTGSSIPGLNGAIDELRIWNLARTAVTIRRTMRQSLNSASGQFQVWSFDSPSEEQLDSELLIRSDLSFYEPIRNVNLDRTSSSVLLTWEAPDREARSFVIERSNDGSVYDEIGRVDRMGVESVSGTRELLSFQDQMPNRSVAFYRIRQLFGDGSEKISPPVKMGLGEQDEMLTANLEGNFPNPFNPTTTVTYTVSEPQQIQISVWDLSGQQVSILVDEFKTPGRYEARFEAADLPTGSYFIRMTSRDGIRTHQMILMK